MKRKRVANTIWAALLVFLSGCGGVITPETGTQTASPSSAASPTAASQPMATAPFQPTPATPAPTITPTPIIHVIQEQETLGAIAAAYGVSVEALRAANGIENPLLLQVGQELVIPTGEEEMEDQPDLLLPTPTPLPIGHQGVGFYQTPVGSLWCLGEVVNTTPYTLTNVQVQVTLFNRQGEALIQGNAFAASDILLPSGTAPFDRAPFGILFLSPPPDFASHQVEILRGEYAAALTEGYIPIIVEEEAGASSGPQFEVSGSVRNGDPSRTAADVVVAVTTYADDGRVTGVRQQTLDVGEGLAPGASASFRLRITAHGDPPADFAVTAIGRAPTSEEEEEQPGG